MYDDINYANGRLVGTIVRLKDEPVKVNDIYLQVDGITATVKHLKNGYNKDVLLNELNLEPVPLGFCNTPRGLSYLTRVPLRRDWRQGLRQHNMVALMGVDPRFATERYLRRTIVGDYPTFKDALKQLKERKEDYGFDHKIAFCRDFAIDESYGTPKILYKWFGVVGDVKGGIPKLINKFAHLNDMLEEYVK